MIPVQIAKLLDQIMKMADKKKADQKLGEIADIIYFGGLDSSELKQVLQKMIGYLAKEKDQVVRETLLNTILEAIVKYDVGEALTYDEIIPILDKFNEEELGYALDILGFSRDDNYLPVLSKYLQHPVKEIRETAADAIEEIKYHN